MSRKKKDKSAQSTRQLMGIDSVKDYCIATRMGDLVFFIIKPTNISVLPDSSISARIYALLNVVKGQAEIEMLALNSKESFERNKTFYQERQTCEELPAIRKLLEQDSTHLDRIQVLMASSREFYIIIRLRKDSPSNSGDGRSHRSSTMAALMVRFSTCRPSQKIVSRLVSSSPVPSVKNCSLSRRADSIIRLFHALFSRRISRTSSASSAHSASTARSSSSSSSIPPPSCTPIVLTAYSRPSQTYAKSMVEEPRSITSAQSISARRSVSSSSAVDADRNAARDSGTMRTLGSPAAINRDA